MTYKYCITTDTTITDSGVLSALDSTLWATTSLNYSLISFPMVSFNSGIAFIDSTSYTLGDITVQKRIVFSKFFIYCTDGFGAVSEVRSKIFGRSNTEPTFPRIFSSKLGLNGFSRNWQTVGPDSAVLVLSHETENWLPIDFTWTGLDPDGNSVKLEYRWELWERERIGWTDELIALVASSDGWSAEETSRSFSQEIWDHNQNGQYAFKVFVRDDALEECSEHSTVNFQVFVPSFDKGIMLIDDNDPTLYPPGSNYLIMGNPDPVQALSAYEQFLNYSGYYSEGAASDSLSLYRIRKFEKGVAFVGWDYIWEGDVIIDSTAVYRATYNPRIEELVKYRLIIITSDDRSNKNGIDFLGEPPYLGYNRVLSQYLDVGGKIFILGHSVLMGKVYTSPDQLPVNQYKEPFAYAFDGYEESGQGISSSTETFFRDYFGISGMTFPEQKTHFIENSPTPTLIPSDYKLTDNYDFIGVEKYGTFTEAGFADVFRLDSARVNGAWFDRLRTVSIYNLLYKYALKDNGTVFTGVPSFSISKGEEIYRYRSLYDLPVTDYNDSLAFEYNGTDTLFHKLYWEDVLTSETGPVLHRSGTVASRYAEENGQFKTAFFGMPSYFMDNSGNEVSEMFKAMVDWFDLSVNPADNWKKK